MTDHSSDIPTVDGCAEPDWQALAPLYALDALDDAERRGFETHLTTCAVCQRELVSFQETATELAVDDAVVPPPDLKADVLAAIQSTPQLPPVEDEPQPIDLRARRAQSTRAEEPSEGRPSRGRWLLAAAAVALVAAGGLAVVRATTSSTGLDDRFAELAAAEDLITTELDGADAEGGGTITVSWSAGRDELAVEVADLASVADDQTYALWLLPDGGDPVPATLFRPDADGDGVVAVGDVADIDAAGWGVTIEPTGGSEQPTSDIVFSATVG